SAQEIGQGTGEGMFVAYRVARLPVLIRDQQPPRTLRFPCAGRVEEFEVIQVFQVEPQHSLGAVDLETILVAATDGVARGFERAKRAVLESREEERRVVHVAAGSECL